MYEKFSHVSDDAWLYLLKRSINESEIGGVSFPLFPDEGTQVLFTSLKWDAALDEAYTFFKITKNACNKFAKPIGQGTRYLDFGIGWGRITRMFLKDLNPENIFGVDVTPEILSVSKKLMTVGEYKLCLPRGQLEFPDESIDLVTAFSVFSHLSPGNGKHWLREMHRIMRPGGLVVLTTLSHSFIKRCINVAQKPKSSKWAEAMAASVTQSYPDWKTRLRNFPDDEMLYLASGGGFESMEASDYGWAMVPEAYARNHWGDWFDLVEYKDKKRILPQAYMVLRRK